MTIGTKVLEIVQMNEDGYMILGTVEIHGTIISCGPRKLHSSQK